MIQLGKLISFLSQDENLIVACGHMASGILLNIVSDNGLLPVKFI